MRVGIVGTGQIAKIHGSVILKQPDVKVVGLADKDVYRAKTLAAQWQVNQIYKDAEVMIEEQKPDVVHVLVPPEHHAHISMIAMNKGCHVLVEKPMALSIADAETMIEVAKRSGVQLCVNHNMIFDALVQRAMALSSQGVIGDVISVEASYLYDARRNPVVLQDGAQHCHWSYELNGGPLQDQMPHPASLVMEFIPEMEEIHWVGQNRGVLPKAWNDEIRVLVKSNTVLGYISISLSERPDAMSLAIKGTKGVLHADLFNNILTVQKRSDLPRALDRGFSGFRKTVQCLKDSLGNIYNFSTGRIDKSAGIGPLILRFYESIRKGGEPPVCLHKSLRVVDLIAKIWPVSIKGGTEGRSFVQTTRKQHGGARVLVTGASGFIGVHLVKKLLSENIRVRALVRPNSIHAGRLKGLAVEIVEGNLADSEVLYEASKGIKTIYHAGAPMSSNWEEQYQIAIKGTKQLIEAALTQGVDRFVHVSSLAIYDLNRIMKNTLVREESPYHQDPRRIGAYAYSKIEGEKLMLDAYQDHGLGVTVVRPGIVIGPMGRVFFPHLGYRYQDRLFLPVGKADTILPLTYVDNTVDGIYQASIEDKCIGQVYNLVDDGEITVRQYLEKFIEMKGNQTRMISLPYMLPYLATAFYEIGSSLGVLKKGVTSRAQLKWKQAPVRFDNTKAKNDFGWQQQVSIEEGLIRTFEWYFAGYR